MKKISSLIYLVATTLGLSAQEYIKFSKDTIISNIKFFKNEIYKAPTIDTQSKKAIFSFANQTFEINQSDYEFVKSQIKNYAGIKNSLIKKKDSISYLIDLSQIPGIDSPKIISSNGTPKSISKKSESVDISEAGETFRLIIPNTPTIIYNASEIMPANEPDRKIGVQRSFFSKNKLFFSIIGLLILGGVVFLLRKRFFGVKKTEPIKVKYPGGGLHAFADSCKIQFKFLQKLNSELIPRDYERLEEKKRKQLNQKLTGQFLVVGYQAPDEMNNTTTNQYDPIFTEKEDEKEATHFKEKSNYEDTNNVIGAIKRLESSLSSKIDSLSSNKAATEKVNQLTQEKESLTLQVKLLTDKVDISTNEKNEVIKELILVKESKSSLEANLSKYSDKLIFVEFLENYARTTVDYFELLRSIEDKSFEVSRKLSLQNENEAVILSLLLLKHQSGIPVGVGKWEEIVSEIKNKKTISNSELIRGLSQPPTPEEKFKTFQRTILAEVLEKYTVSTLLLAEELSHFSKFTGQNTSIIQDIELSFTPLVKEIVNKSKSIGLEVKHVPLFENYQPYASFIKVVSDKCSMVYRNIKVDKDGIAEILSYGFGSEQTKVILG